MSVNLFGDEQKEPEVVAVEKVQKLDLFREIIPDLLNKKEGILNDDNEKDYLPFIINQALSYYADCILHANVMNINPHLDKKMQYDYYFYALRKMKRPYNTWLKKQKNDDLDLVKEAYCCSNKKGREILNILTKEQLKVIREKLDKGGK